MDKQFEQSRDNIHRRSWQLLNVLKTPSGAEYRIQKQNLATNYAIERASGISVLLNTAHQYYENCTKSESIISLYYMAFKIIQCFIILESPSIYSLSKLQESSKLGHGLKMELLHSKHFPSDVFFHYSELGMFKDYLEMKHWNNMKIRKTNKENFSNLTKSESNTQLFDRNIFSGEDLLRRIPELNLYRFELSLRHPLYYKTGQDRDINDSGAEILLDDEDWNSSLNSMKIAIRKINRPSANYNAVEVGMLKFSPDPVKVFHYDTHLRLPLQNYWIEKLNEIGDMISIYFSLLYILSILTRYYPAEWERMSYGDKRLTPFLETFSTYCLNAFPLWLCNRIYGGIIF